MTEVVTHRASKRFQVLACAVGTAVGLALLPLTQFSLPPFELNITNLALLGLPALIYMRTRSRAWHFTFLMFCGIVLQGLVYLIFVPHRFDAAASMGGLACVAAYTFAVGLFGREGAMQSRRDLLIASISAALTVCAYRLFAIGAADIPNEQRSLIIDGHEIHHLNVGLVGALLMTLIDPPQAEKGRVLYFVLLGSGLGAIVDQSTYFFYAELGDAAYYSAFSLAGPIVQLGLLSLIAWYSPPR